MSARVGLRAEAYRALMKGTAFLDLAAASKHWKDAEGFQSIYGSSRTVDVFNVKNQVYKQPLKIETYLDPSLSEELVANR
jgi:NitT/TauT family transport system substrate-binding protein